MEFITLGIGTPSSIPTFLLVGLSPEGAVQEDIAGDVALSESSATISLSETSPTVGLSETCCALTITATSSDLAVSLDAATVNLSEG